MSDSSSNSSEPVLPNLTIGPSDGPNNWEDARSTLHQTGGRRSGDGDEEEDDDPSKYLEEENQAGDDEDNKIAADGTRERNLTLWEAAPWSMKMYAVLESGSFPSDIPSSTEKLSFIISFGMIGIILLSCASVLIESYPVYRENPVPVELQIVEVLCVVIFTFDMIVRLITTPDKLDYAMDALNWIDLIAVCPFYIENFAGLEFVEELRIVRVLRLVRIFRIFRMLKTQNIPGLAAVLEAIRTSIFGITLFVALGGVVLLIMATAAYYAERGTRREMTVPYGRFYNQTMHVWLRECHISDGCTEEITPFQSIPDAFWWCFNTMSTVGLGDVVTKTGLGRFVACLTMIAGIFIVAFPTMILSGNFDAARGHQRILRVAWEQLRGVEKAKTVESPKSRLVRKMGWSADEEEDLAAIHQTTVIQKQKKVEHKLIVNEEDEDEEERRLRENGPMIALPAISRAGLRTVGGRRSKKRKDKEIAKTVGTFMYNNMPVPVKRDVNNKHAYYYPPLFSLATCGDGGPAVRVIWGMCGQPTIVKLNLIIDSEEARESAIHLVEAVDGIGTVRCEIGGGFEVRHYTSLSVAEPGEPQPFEMSVCRTTSAFRNSDCPLCFRWTRSESLLHGMTEDEVAELALSHLLGSSLFIQQCLPEPLKIQRIPIVQQVIHHTKLQRELAVISEAQEYGGDQYAYICKADVALLLEGVSTKVIVDINDNLEDRKKLDGEIIDKLLARLRELRVLAVPSACKTSIYNAELLSPTDIVYEIPMSLFDADEFDEVEEDALGYCEVKLRPFMARTLRVDIKMDFGVEDMAYEDEESEEDDDEHPLGQSKNPNDGSQDLFSSTMNRGANLSGLAQSFSMAKSHRKNVN